MKKKGKELQDALHCLENCCPGSTDGLKKQSSSKGTGKELQDALHSLESCCPGSTHGLNQQTPSAALREALHNLDRAREREQRLREESDALLEGMDIIINSENTRKAFNMVLDVLKRLLNFDEAFVLRVSNNGRLCCVASSSPLFERLTWQSGAMFNHVLSGNSVNLQDICTSTVWQEQPIEMLRNVTSALHTPFNTILDRAILVCTSAQEGFFNKSHIDLLERFSPLASQALYNIEINDRLRDEIRERKQAEANLKDAFIDLQEAREELITINEALSAEIQERHKVEEALREAHDDLELKVEERTSELRSSNVKLQHEVKERMRAEKEKESVFAQLLQSQKMESIGLLASGVAHDFNNILTTIVGYSELLMLTVSEKEPIWKRLESIYEAGNRAAALTRQLLAFSRKQVMEMKVINLNILVRNMTKMLNRMLGEKIEMKLILPEAIGNIMADPGQVEQIIMNLIINSRDAMPHGGHLTIKTENFLLKENDSPKHSGMEPGEYVKLSFEDTGEGMDQEVQKEIFEPFFTTKVKGKGTGLGLATVHGIVEQHNSFIFVDSEQGRGTLFSIYFPVSKEKVSDGKIISQESDNLRRGTETVLIVDDESSIRNFITHTLSPLGYKCLSASNGEEALQLIQQSNEEIDLILTDIIMPLMNGPDLVKQLKKLYPEHKVIFMSGYMSNVGLSEIVAGNDAFLQKPIAPKKLLKKITEVLGD